MTPASIRILAFAAIASLPLLAQQQPSPTPQPSPGSSPQATPPQQTNPEPGASQGNGQAAPVPSTANSPEVANPQLRPVTGELQDKLDTKTAKAGDAIVVKITQPATTASGVEIPKGSKIMGHIIEVAAKGQDGDNSRVTIQFDQAQLKNGQNLPIRTVIQSVSPPGTTAGPDAAGGPPAAGPSSGNSGAAATNPSATSNQSNPSQSSAQPGGSPDPAGGAPAPGTVVATKGNIAIRTTSIPGVLLIGSTTGQPFSNAAGALLGAKQDVQLDNGTVMVVAIAQAPQSANGR